MTDRTQPEALRHAKYLTVVYRDINPGDEARELIMHPKITAASWSHVMNERDRLAALVEAQQPATHVQQSAEIEHVAGDVSKNGAESNMAQQPAPSAAAAITDTEAFQNFHRLLCARFGYVHDERDWRRDQLSLVEHIARQAQPSPTPQADSQPAPVRDDDGYWGGGPPTKYAAHAQTDSVTAPAGGVVAGIEAAAKLLERKADDFARENGSDDLGSLSFGRGAHADAKLEYHSTLLELAEEIRSLAPPPPAQAADSVLEDADPIRALIAEHATILDQNESAYFELCYHRATGWMAWITDKPLCMPPVVNPDRKVLAQGQGDTADEACRDAARKQGANHD